MKQKLKLYTKLQKIIYNIYVEGIRHLKQLNL